MQKLRLFGMNGVLVLILAARAFSAPGQPPVYLILIDAENRQPFTVRIGDNLMSSSATGHLLISRLRDTVYRVSIRFLHKSTPDQIFPVNMHKRDLGLQIKASGDSWVLFNWQTRETIQPLKEVDSSRLLEYGEKRNDGFSRLMAAVVNDSSVMYGSFTWDHFAKDSAHASADIKSPIAGTPLPAKIKDSIRTNEAIVNQHAAANNPPAKENIPVAKTAIPAMDSSRAVPRGGGSTIKKIREVSLKISRKIVYTDINPDGQTDTVTLFVYFENLEEPAKKSAEDPMVTARRLLKNDTATLTKPGTPPLALAAKPAAQAPAIDSSCRQEATDQDVESLRSAILVRNTPEEKISAASGAFSLKCFSVAQVRQLADLFVADRDKYGFLNTAWGHVSDADHFQELGGLLSEKAYLKKFHALMQKHG